MNFKKTNLGNFDEEFDSLYPKKIRELSHYHWTKIDVAKTAIDWLNVKEDELVLDIGSGVGKFCCLGGLISKGTFVGVEQRADLCEIANETADTLGLKNVRFMNLNIMEIDFKAFDSFYYFNPFGEQLSIFNAIDNKIQFSRENYQKYENYVHAQLADLKVGTKVVTYCSDDFILPGNYKMGNMLYEGLLTLWIKTSK